MPVTVEMQEHPVFPEEEAMLDLMVLLLLSGCLVMMVVAQEVQERNSE
jgi:hypothetical protein